MAGLTLDELAAVAAVAARRSFRAAAVELGMSPSSLSHMVAATERRLGVRLFNRTTRSVAPTEAAEAFLARVQPALRDIADAVEMVNRFRDSPAGLLRLNASEAAAQRVLPIVLEFLATYPDMRVDLVTDGRMIDIVSAGFDAGLRLAETVPQDMVSVPSGALLRWEFARQGDEIRIDPPGRLILGSVELTLQAARAGAGIAYVTERAAAADLQAGRLRRVLEAWTPSFPGISLYYPRQRLASAGLRAFVDLVQAFRQRGVRAPRQGSDQPAAEG